MDESTVVSHNGTPESNPVLEFRRWLEDEGISPDICEILEENEIDRESFEDCTENDLKDMVKKIGPTKRLLRLKEIIQEMELIMKWDVGSLYLKFKKHWEEKWRPAILKYDTVVRTKKTSAERESPCLDDNMRAMHALANNLTVVARKEKIPVPCVEYWISTYDISTSPEEAAKELPKRASPRIAVFVSDDMDTIFHIFIDSEEKPFCHLKSFTKGLLVWLATYYVFHLEYNKFSKDPAMFLTEFVMGIPIQGRRSATYLSVSTDISRHCM